MIEWGETVCGIGSSPHTRGTLQQERAAARNGRIIPAYAGNTPPEWASPPATWDHPRIRGEHPTEDAEQQLKNGSSPHTRGTHLAELHQAVDSRIISAYAGNTTGLRIAISSSSDHPRIRGEHAFRPDRVEVAVGSSPHTRGTLGGSNEQIASIGIIPAYAGNTAWAGGPGCVVWDHPRIRGEHTPTSCSPAPQPGSSPHTRGTLLRPLTDPARIGIIPAYAGNTTKAYTVEAYRGDHPRIRGEHLHAHTRAAVLIGSSPHTRGTPDRQGPQGAQQRIIPAYAGNTGR